MKLIKLKIIKADTCGGLLNGLFIPFRGGLSDLSIFEPLCLIGPNGTGKSQVLQIIAEIFQLAYSSFIPDEAKTKTNKTLQFDLEYEVINDGGSISKVRLFTSKKRNKIIINLNHFIDGGWSDVDKKNAEYYLPSLVVAYTSGDNETLSRPFYASRGRYAKEVAVSALPTGNRSKRIKNSKLMLIDYGTSLEVLIANLLQNEDKPREYLLSEPNLKALHSFRCIIQLNHPGAPGKNGILLTDELQESIDNLKKCATCFDYNEKKRTYIFDFLIKDETYKAFNFYWKKDALSLYSSLHKLSMLNDLMIKGNGVFKQDPYEKGFSSRLVEPVDNDKVFRFEKIKFISNKSETPVDYVSLSDGEHQLAQLHGTLCMVNYPNVLFLLDEPESHFNPYWRVEFISKLINLPTCGGKRNEKSLVAQQDCLITTHSPFVPSDMKSDNVIIFNKNNNSDKVEVRRPTIQTYGSKFDAILAECFDISPQISALSRDRAKELLKSGTKQEIEQAIAELGESTARMRLAAKLSMMQGD